MALGGGTFVAQNKILSGAYLNFVSAVRADASLSDRGIAAMAFELNWGGVDGEAPSIADYQTFLNKMEAYAFHAIGVVSETAAINQLFSAYTKRLRDEMGVKF